MWAFKNRRIICTFLVIISAINSICIVSSAKEREYTLCKVLIEASGGVIISGENEETPVSVGTMTKLMTVLLAAEQVADGKISLDEKIKTSNYANTMQGAQIWLMVGEEITVDELFKAVIIGNANDASVVLAECVSHTEEDFVKKMNTRAKELGMKNTVFTNCCGYYDDDKQISTAHDLAKLCAELAKHDFLRDYFTCWRDFVRDNQTELVNANDLVKSYDGLIGFKAGYSENSGYCIAVGAERNGVTYISVILGCRDKEDCSYKAKTLLNTAFSGYTVFTPELPNNIPAEISVRRGMTKKIPVECEYVRSVVLPNDAVNSVSSRVIMADYVYAPVKKGWKVGEVQFLRNEKMLFYVNIVVSESAEEINIRKAFGIMLKKLLTF